VADLDACAKAIAQGDSETVVEKVEEALQEQVAVEVILDEGLMSGMAEVSRTLGAAEDRIPEVLIAARAMKAGLARLRAYCVNEGGESLGPVVLGAVLGDLHDVGIQVVALLLQRDGFEVIDLGVDVPADQFVAAIQQHNAKVVAICTYLNDRVDDVAKTVEVIKSAGLPGVKLIVGGGALSQEAADRCGADGFAPDAASAVELIKSFHG
jgi:5-methyltetrahydrofolate--homocysteine methyltransferase